ncbi:MAG: hypothetical protein CL675_04845 [Bdellovibrionaceae bacterium]|nr:hypothetical protein [Pseudobdellovibrionaceae bacterium]
MSTWILIQILVNLVLLLGLFMVWLRLKRPPQEDPRLSRGLQLLQSKISVIEDLSDQTDHQVKQLVQILEQRARFVQQKMQAADAQIEKIEQSMKRSLEVAKIFQDKIPHKEIIERQTSMNYIKAARMAHGGQTAEEISEALGIPLGEAEFIAKVNKDQLMFDEDRLPDWAQSALTDESQSFGGDDLEIDIPNNYQDAFQTPQPSLDGLEQLKTRFQEACEEFDRKQEDSERQGMLGSEVEEQASQVLEKAKTAGSKVSQAVKDVIGQIRTSQGRSGEVAEEPQSTVDTESDERLLETTKKVQAQTTEAMKELASRLTQERDLPRNSSVIRPGNTKIPVKTLGVQNIEFPVIKGSESKS